MASPDSNSSAAPISQTPAASEPQKYIRTFAGDMEMMKKGGQPELAPLVTKKKKQEEPQVKIEDRPLRKEIPTIPTPPPPPGIKNGEAAATPAPQKATPRPRLPDKITLVDSTGVPAKLPDDTLNLDSVSSSDLSTFNTPLTHEIPVQTPIAPIETTPVAEVPAPVTPPQEIEPAPEEMALPTITTPEALPEAEAEPASVVLQEVPPKEEPMPTPIEVPVAEPVEPPQAKPVASPSPIETYTLDFSDRMKTENATTATVLAAESDAQTLPATPAPKKRSSVVFIVIAIILILGGGAGFYYAYLKHEQNGTHPIVLAPKVSAPIYVDDRIGVSGTGDALVSAITSTLATPPGEGKIRQIYLQSSSATTPSIFQALELPAPAILIRNINGQESMAGVIEANGVTSTFFILSVSSYSDTFAGMLAWESTMPNDLAQLNPPSGDAATSTTSMTGGSKVTGSTFTDTVIDNHNARVHVGPNGMPDVVYGYWNQTTLVIAHDPQAFTDIIERLATSQSQ